MRRKTPLFLAVAASGFAVVALFFGCASPAENMDLDAQALENEIRFAQERAKEEASQRAEGAKREMKL